MEGWYSRVAARRARRYYHFILSRDFKRNNAFSLYDLYGHTLAQEPLPQGHERYNFARPFLGHLSYIQSLSDLYLFKKNLKSCIISSEGQKFISFSWKYKKIIQVITFLDTVDVETWKKSDNSKSSLSCLNFINVRKSWSFGSSTEHL